MTSSYTEMINIMDQVFTIADYFAHIRFYKYFNNFLLLLSKKSQCLFSPIVARFLIRFQQLVLMLVERKEKWII